MFFKKQNYLTGDAETFIEKIHQRRILPYEDDKKPGEI